MLTFDNPNLELIGWKHSKNIDDGLISAYGLPEKWADEVDAVVTNSLELSFKPNANIDLSNPPRTIRVTFGDTTATFFLTDWTSICLNYQTERTSIQKVPFGATPQYHGGF